MKIKRKLPQLLSSSSRTAFNPLLDNCDIENIQTQNTHKHKDVFLFKNTNIIDNDITYVLEEERLCIQIIDNETVSNKVFKNLIHIYKSKSMNVYI
jgi:hypothetical protein